jgi:hypothetical protein
MPLEVDMAQPITLSVIYWMLVQLLNKTGVRPTAKMIGGQRCPKRTALMISHGFRKYVISNMISAKLEYTAREKLVGHQKSIGLDKNYDRRPQEEIMAEYLKAVPNLTVNSEERERARAERLELENNEQKQIIAKTFEMYERMQQQINEIQNNQNSAQHK